MDQGSGGGRREGRRGSNSWKKLEPWLKSKGTDTLKGEEKKKKIVPLCSLGVAGGMWEKALSQDKTLEGMHAKSLQSCPTLCDPMDCSPPGPSVHGILQARILKWVAIPSSSKSSQPRDRTQVFMSTGTGSQFLYHWRRLSTLWPTKTDLDDENGGCPSTCATSSNFQGCYHFPDGEDGTEKLSCEPKVTPLKV